MRELRGLPPFSWPIVPFGITVGIGYELAAHILGEFHPETRPLGFLLGAGLTVCTTYQEQILRSVRIKKLPPAATKIGQLLTQFRDPWERKLASELVELVRNALSALDAPTPINGEEALYAALTQHAKALRTGEELFAICAHKSWDALYVRDYLDANIEAAERRGAFIHRVFYEFDHHARVAAQRQANHGIVASVLRATKIGALKSVNQIPSDLGIAIFNGTTVFIHRGVGSNARAFRYDCVHFAALVRTLFGMVEGMAERIPPNTPQGNNKPSRNRKAPQSKS